MTEKKRVLILGIDGYIGYSLAVYLSKQGNYEIGGVDDQSRRQRVNEVKGLSAIPVKPFTTRFLGLENLSKIRGGHIGGSPHDLVTIEEYQPDVVIHLAEQPSAPYSMSSIGRCVKTQVDNVSSTLGVLHGIKIHSPETHLIKLGTMGEYGTPSCPIPEGVFPEGVKTGTNISSGYPPESDLSGMMFPRRAGSWYHLSKVHDSYNVRFACDNYGLRATDIMQGVVYGSRIPEMDKYHRTRFDIDECFGTVINRFCAQAVIETPITPYGKGEQKRGFLPLQDVMQCLQIAIDNPPDPGEYRTWNQFDRVYSINQLAEIVESEAKRLGLNPSIERIPNPRKEQEEHEYDVCTDILRELGYQPEGDIEKEVNTILTDLIPNRHWILSAKESISPKMNWVGSKERISL